MHEAEMMDPEAIQDSEILSLPPQKPAIESTCILFTPDDAADNQVGNIMTIIDSCLKDAKRGKTKFAIKTITQLFTISEYVTLQAHYWEVKCKRPCLSASIAIARRMGKGPYFTCQIHHNELFLLKNCQLPPPKAFIRHGYRMLLDNEVILHNVRTYLALQSLGSVCPQTFCQHVNTVILPALGVKATITESTAQRWLRLKLGYQSKESKKGMYVDSHERPDVIKEREEFLDQMFDKFEQYVGHIHFPNHQMSDHCILIKFDGFL